MTPPLASSDTTSWSAPRNGRPLTLIYTPSGTPSLRRNRAKSSIDSPRMALTSGNSWVGTGVSPSTKKMPYSSDHWSVPAFVMPLPTMRSAARLNRVKRPSPSAATTPSLMLSNTISMVRVSARSASVMRRRVSSFLLSSVTSWKTITPPRTAPDWSRSGFPLTCTQAPSGRCRLRTQSSMLTVVWLRSARGSASSSAGTSVLRSGAYNP